MRIQLNEFEKGLMMAKAKEYKDKTGDNFSMRLASFMLSEKVTEQLEELLNKIFDQKLKDFEEEKTRGQ